MNQIWLRLRAAVNRVSTAATSWWCLSAMRHVLTGNGPTAQQRQYIRDRRRRAAAFPPSAEQWKKMKARAEAINELLGQDDHGA